MLEYWFLAYLFEPLFLQSGCVSVVFSEKPFLVVNMTFLVGRQLAWAITATAGSGFLLSVLSSNKERHVGAYGNDDLDSVMTKVLCPVS